MDTNETKEHIELLNTKLMRSIDMLIDAYKEGYEFFKEKRPDGGNDSYYAAVLAGFADGVIKSFKRGGPDAVVVSDPIVVAVATIKYLNEHPEFKADLMF